MYHEERKCTTKEEKYAVQWTMMAMKCEPHLISERLKCGGKAFPISDETQYNSTVKL